MTQTIFIRGARQLLTLRGVPGPRRGAALSQIDLIEDGSLLIHDGVIVQVGSTRRIENLKEARLAIEISARGAVIMPGFIDPLLSAPAATTASGGLIRASAFYDACSALMRTAAHHGTLHAQCVTSTTTGDLPVQLSALRQLTLLAGRVGGISRCWRVDDGIPLPEALATIRCLVERKLAQRVELSAHAEPKRLNSLCAVTSAEKLGVNLSYSGGNPGKLQRAISVASPRMVICTGVLSDDDCQLLADSGLPVVVAPTRCLHEDIYSGSLQRLLAHGANISLASAYDEAGTPVFNMQMAISLAVLNLGLNAEQAILAATINAAHAAGVSHFTGTLEAGRRANLLLLDLSDYRELPRRFGSNHALLALRDGKLVLNRTGHKITFA